MLVGLVDSTRSCVLTFTPRSCSRRSTLIEQLAQTKDIPVARVDIPAQLKGALFLVSDEHGVVPATETDAAEADAATVAFFADGYEKLRARRS